MFEALIWEQMLFILEETEMPTYSWNNLDNLLGLHSSRIFYFAEFLCLKTLTQHIKYESLIWVDAFILLMIVSRHISLHCRVFQPGFEKHHCYPGRQILQSPPTVSSTAAFISMLQTEEAQQSDHRWDTLNEVHLGVFADSNPIFVCHVQLDRDTTGNLLTQHYQDSVLLYKRRSLLLHLINN